MQQCLEQLCRVEEETYEDLAMFPPGGSPLPPSPSNTSLNLVPPTTTSSSSLAPPSPQHGGGSADSSPTLSRKKLSKDEKKKQKEQERLDREAKKRNEVKTKNRQKGLRAHKVHRHLLLLFFLGNTLIRAYNCKALLTSEVCSSHLLEFIGQTCRHIHAQLTATLLFVEMDQFKTLG